jgi:DNA-binding SARP family transcriptional activator
VGVWRTLIALERGDLDTARECAGQIVRVGRDLDNAVTVAHAHAFLGRVAVLAGDLDDASAHLQTALHEHLELGDWWGLSQDLEWLSALAAGRGRWADSARLAGAVDALRERVGIVLYPVDRPHRERRTAEAREKLGDAYDRHYAEGRTLPREALVTIATDDSMHSTAEFHVPTPAAPAADATGRASLRVLALGPLQVFVGGRLVEPAAWGSARPRELLVYLLMHPEGRTKEQAGLAFWPDASTAQLRNSFHVTLHRLRKALGGAELVTLVGDRYRVDPGAVAEFDVADFERDVAAARRALKRQQEGAAEQLEQALARFRGDFLDGEPAGDWHVEHRDRLQRVYVDALMELGARLAHEERHARAADVYRRVLARDELHEEALLALMRCHAALGERSQALRAYRRFAERLRQELGAEPKGEATRLFERLQQGGGGAEARAGGTPQRR